MVVKDVYRPAAINITGTLTIHSSFSTVKNVNMFMVFKNNNGTSQVTFNPFPMNFNMQPNADHYINYTIEMQVIDNNLTAGTYYLTFTVENTDGTLLLDYSVSDPQFRIV